MHMRNARNGSMRRIPVILPALAVALAVLPGCLITSANRVDESGIAVTSETLAQLEPGVTTEAWLVSALGEATSRTPTGPDGRTHILRYDHSVTKKSSGSVFLIFGGRSQSSRVSRTFFEVTDGVVMRFWKEASN